MFRLLLTVFLAIAASLVYGYFQELNPGTVTIRMGPESAMELSPSALVLTSMAIGALLVTLLVGVRETRVFILNWRANRLRHRETKVEALHKEGVHAFLAKRTSEAISLLQKALALDSNHVDSLLWLGNIYRAERNFQEAIRLHQKARGLDERNTEILLDLAKDLEGARRFEESLQVLAETLRHDPVNVTALIRQRELLIRLEKWSDALEVQHRLLKAALPDQDRKIESTMLVGIMYEVGRQLLERGHPEKARRYFRGAIKRDKSFLPAYIGLGEILVHEGKTKNAAEILEKVYVKTKNPIILHRLEELYLETGEPGEIIRVYQNALQQDPHNPVLKFYLGKLYYRLEMIDAAYDLLSSLEGPQDQISDFHKILANLYLRKQQTDEAVVELKKALGLRKRVVVPYQCTACQQESGDWAGRCRHCGRWNTFVALPWVDASRSDLPLEGPESAIRSIPYQSMTTPFETV